MKDLQSMLKDCDIKECLLLLMGGTPKLLFSKMLERYYSLYCMAVEVWYGGEFQNYMITDFMSSGFRNGEEAYFFYGRNIDSYEKSDEILDWDKVLHGELKIHVPDCIFDRINDVTLCSIFLKQMYENCTIDVQKNKNRKLLDHINCSRPERTSRLIGIEKYIEQFLHYDVYKERIENAILEYKESTSMSVKWGTLLENQKNKIPYSVVRNERGSDFLIRALKQNKLPNVYRWFYSLDVDNPPELYRLYRRLECLQSLYSELQLVDYLKVNDERKRIIIEYNACYERLPLIYVRNGVGEQIELCDVSIPELLCMSIRVLDTNICNPEEVLALLVYYMEYPIRVERIQRNYFIKSLIGIKKLYLTLLSK